MIPETTRKPQTRPTARPVKCPMESIFFDAVIRHMIRRVGATEVSAERPLNEMASIIYMPRSPQMTPDAPIDLVNGDLTLWTRPEKRPPNIMIRP